MKISGATNSFHDARNENSATVTMPGATPRSRTWRSALVGPQPSTSAASSSSTGSASKELRIMNSPNGNWNMASIRPSPSSEFCSPIQPSRM